MAPSQKQECLWLLLEAVWGPRHTGWLLVGSRLIYRDFVSEFKLQMKQQLCRARTFSFLMGTISLHTSGLLFSFIRGLPCYECVPQKLDGHNVYSHSHSEYFCIMIIMIMVMMMIVVVIANNHTDNNNNNNNNAVSILVALKGS